MKFLINRFVISACGVVLLSVAASCSKGDEARETKLDAAAPPAPAISEVIFSGNIKQIETVPGKGDALSAAKQGDVPAVALSSKGPKREPDGDGDSGIVRLTPAMSTTLSGRRVTVSITLRKAPQNGSSVAKAMYSRPGVGTSGWRDLPAGADFSTVTFDYDVPTQEGPRGPDLISIWADPEGQGRAVEIRTVEIKAPAR